MKRVPRNANNSSDLDVVQNIIYPDPNAIKKVVPFKARSAFFNELLY